jgi:putative hydrolase of the HAD superfamily
MPLTNQTLLIDLDDTLCENNVYFERAIAKFISFLNHREMSPPQVREILNQVERESILEHGYGLHSFAHSLVRCFERLSVEPVTTGLHQQIWRFAHEIAEHPLELIEGVPETLATLAQRNHLIVMTKGDVTEQSGKIERSGLRAHFNAVEIVAEKNKPTYESIVDKYGLDPGRSWMIGNSPKSDINPALAAGLNAVFIPHDQTWVLEHEEVTIAPNGQRLLVLERFRQLAEHF